MNNARAGLPITDVWRYILVCLSVVLLSCALKNYLRVWVHDTSLCEYLCPALFGARRIDSFPVLDAVFGYQGWLGETAQAWFDRYWHDHFRGFSFLVVAPLAEEAVYRGPLYLWRRTSYGFLWWVLALLLTLIFAMSHNRSGLAVLPVLVLGFCAALLIRLTDRLWPSLALHFLQNFFVLSVTVYQAFLWGA